MRRLHLVCVVALLVLAAFALTEPFRANSLADATISPIGADGRDDESLTDLGRMNWRRPRLAFGTLPSTLIVAVAICHTQLTGVSLPASPTDSVAARRPVLRV